MRFSKRSIWTVVIVGIVLLMIGVFILGNRPSQKVDYSAAEKEGGPGTVVIDNTEGLSNLLLNEQYTTVMNQLVTYIQTKIDSKIDHAYVEGTPKVNQDGSVSFTVKTENPNTQFEVSVDRTTYTDKIIFTVLGTDYSEILQVY